MLSTIFCMFFFVYSQSFATAPTKHTYTPLKIPQSTLQTSPAKSVTEAKTESTGLEALIDVSSSDIDEIAWQSAPSGACGYIDAVGSTTDFNLSSENYFFISLPRIVTTSKDSKPIELHFFKDKKNKTKPDYVLDKTGLRQGNKTICKWKMEKDASFPFLEDCPKEKHKFLGLFHKFENEYCTVINVHKNHSTEESKFLLEVKIGNEILYLDASNLTEAKEDFFWTKETRARKTYDLLSSKISNYASFMMKIKESSAFKKMTECYWKNDVECLSRFVSSQYKEDIKSFCAEPYSEEAQKSYTLSYIKEFINFINLFQIEKLQTRMKGSIEDQIFFKPKDFHESSAEPSIGVKFKGEELVLDTFYYGISC